MLLLKNQENNIYKFDFTKITLPAIPTYVTFIKRITEIGTDMTY